MEVTLQPEDEDFIEVTLGNNEEESQLIEGKVSTFPLTRFLIEVHDPYQSKAVMDLTRSALRGVIDSDDEKDFRGIPVIFTSEKEADTFEEKLRKIKNISYIKKPCPAINQEGKEVEVLNVRNGELTIREDNKVRRLTRNDIIFDSKMGYYIVKNDEKEDKSEEIKKETKENLEQQQRRQRLDKFDLL